MLTRNTSALGFQTRIRRRNGLSVCWEVARRPSRAYESGRGKGSRRDLHQGEAARQVRLALQPGVPTRARCFDRTAVTSTCPSRRVRSSALSFPGRLDGREPSPPLNPTTLSTRRSCRHANTPDNRSRNSRTGSTVIDRIARPARRFVSMRFSLRALDPHSATSTASRGARRATGPRSTGLEPAGLRRPPCIMLARIHWRPATRRSPVQSDEEVAGAT